MGNNKNKVGKEKESGGSSRGKDEVGIIVAKGVVTGKRTIIVGSKSRSNLSIDVSSKV